MSDASSSERLVPGQSEFRFDWQRRERRRGEKKQHQYSLLVSKLHLLLLHIDLINSSTICIGQTTLRPLCVSFLGRRPNSAELLQHAALDILLQANENRLISVNII